METEWVPTGPPPNWRPQGPVERRPRRGLWLVVAAVLVVVTCGGLVTAKVLTDRRDDRVAAERQVELERQEERERAEEREEQAAQRAADVSRYETCLDLTGELAEQLRQADSRLDVGLSQSDLQSLIGDASVAYDQIDIDELEGDCLRAAAKLESAFNNYSTTVSDWNDCIYDTYCDLDNDVLPQLQERWAEASRQLDQADNLVDGLDPDSPDFIGSEDAGGA